MKIPHLLAAAVVLAAAPAAAETITYRYDAKGRLVRVTNGGVTRTYSHDRADNRTRLVVTGAP